MVRSAYRRLSLCLLTGGVNVFGTYRVGAVVAAAVTNTPVPGGDVRIEGHPSAKDEEKA
jgi:hypothetical protein